MGSPLLFHRLTESGQMHMVCLHCSWSDATINLEDRSLAAAVDDIFDSRVFLLALGMLESPRNEFLGRGSMRNLEWFRV